MKKRIIKKLISENINHLYISSQLCMFLMYGQKIPLSQTLRLET